MRRTHSGRLTEHQVTEDAWLCLRQIGWQHMLHFPLGKERRSLGSLVSDCLEERGDGSRTPCVLVVTRPFHFAGQTSLGEGRERRRAKKKCKERQRNGNTERKGVRDVNIWSVIGPNPMERGIVCHNPRISSSTKRRATATYAAYASWGSFA